MNAMQPLLSVCPWIPVIGNHESSDGDQSFRYLNQTFGMVYANPLTSSGSTATTALSHLITKGSYLAPGLHGTTPSGTSSYFSVDVGLIHIAVISNAVEHDDRSPEEIAWLTRDLEVRGPFPSFTHSDLPMSRLFLSRNIESGNGVPGGQPASQSSALDHRDFTLPDQQALVDGWAGCRGVAARLVLGGRRGLR
jgi:hypothetical protein|eukprot:SAG25_NODE_1098_length_4006_cov_14.152035_4_plen_194_part_00